MFCLAARSNDVILFPVEIFDPCELAGQRQMLCEIGEIPFEGSGLDVRDTLCPEYVGNALILFIQFWHGCSPHRWSAALMCQIPERILAIASGAVWTCRHAWIIPLTPEDDKQR